MIVIAAASTAGTVLAACATAAVGVVGAYVTRRLNGVVKETRRTTEVVEGIRQDFARREQEYELERNYRRLQRPVLDAAVGLIVRIGEVAGGRYQQLYAVPWAPGALRNNDIAADKVATTVFRFVRFLGTYAIYRERAGELLPHKCDTDFRLYVDGKIYAALASDGMPGDTILWRDSIAQVGDISIRYSDAWQSVRPVTWPEFVTLIQEPGDNSGFLRAALEPVAAFLRKPSPRESMLGIYLIDLIQDTLRSDDWEPLRTRLLEHVVATGVQWYLYGKDGEGRTDLAKTIIASGLVPRNVSSHLYDSATNPNGLRGG